jgi:hypothetical protein
VRKVLAALGVLFVMTTALGALAIPAGAQVYPPAACSVQVATSVVTFGGTVTVTGSGFTPGSTVPLSLNGSAVASTTASGTGTISTQITIPANATSPVVISAPGCQVSVTPGAVGPLAFTGSDTQPLLIAGLVAVAVGAVAVVGTRRRASTRVRKLSHVPS